VGIIIGIYQILLLYLNIVSVYPQACHFELINQIKLTIMQNRLLDSILDYVPHFLNAYIFIAFLFPLVSKNKNHCITYSVSSKKDNGILKKVVCKTASKFAVKNSMNCI